jgi:hypothetical protein
MPVFDRLRCPGRLTSALLAVVLPVALAGTAAAQPPPPPPPPAPPPPAVYTPELAIPPPAPPAAAEGATDHDLIVGRWGVEARQVAVVQRSLGNDPTCETNCPINLNAFSLRQWRTTRYAWHAGLVFGLGGGSRNDGGTIKSWDTYVGIGPTIGASFLLTNWKHLAVSLSPQLDLVYFAPSGSGAKTLLVDIRGLVEGELHLGFIGLPELSVGTASGLVIDYTHVSSAPSGGLASRWDLGFAGPQSLWGLVTNVYLRFYF